MGGLSEAAVILVVVAVGETLHRSPRNAEKAYNSEKVRDTANDNCTAASKASSNFSSEEHREHSPRPTLWWA